MRGRVIAAIHGKFKVYDGTSFYEVGLKGNVRYFTRNIAVGDYVYFNEKTLIIEKLEPAFNRLIRPRVHNIDQLLIVMSIKEPDFSLLLVETFLTYAHYVEKIKPVVIISKIDLASKEEILEQTTALSKLGVPYYLVDNLNEQGIEEVRELLSGQTSTLMGQTGVGKSALINALYPELDRTTGEISIKGGRGRHTTREVILFPLGDDTYLSDTPGFSSFTLPLFQDELIEHYPGIRNYLGKCYFNDCQHISEEQCAVKDAVARGDISTLSYENYVKIYKELPRRKEQY